MGGRDRAHRDFCARNFCPLAGESGKAVDLRVWPESAVLKTVHVIRHPGVLLAGVQCFTPIWIPANFLPE